MLVEDRWNVVLCRGLPADVLALFAGVCHAAFYPCANDGKLQFREDRRHLNEGLAHGIDFAVSAINCDGAEDHQPHALLLDRVDDPAKLLCASAQTRYFCAYDGRSDFGGFQQEVKRLFDFRVAVFAFRDDLFRACGLQFPNLTVQILPLFFGKGAAGII